MREPPLRSLPSWEKQASVTTLDSSSPYTYSNAAEDEDIKMVKRWHEDADRILIFVSPFVVGIHIALSLLCISWNSSVARERAGEFGSRNPRSEREGGTDPSKGERGKRGEKVLSCVLSSTRRQV